MTKHTSTKTLHIYLITAILCLLLFGNLILFPTVGIDTESIILDQKGLLESWEGMGRIGLVLIKRLLFPFGYHSYLQNGLMLLTLALSLSFLVKKFKLSPLVFNLAFLALPITYSQLYFQLQNFEVVLAFFLLILAIYYPTRKNKVSLASIPITSLVIGFATSVYQSLLLFAISYTAFCLLHHPERRSSKEWLLSWIPIPLGTLCYKGLNIFFNQTPTSNYLDLHFGNKLSLLTLFMLILLLGLLFYKRPTDWKRQLNLFLFLTSPFYLLALTGNLVFRSLFPGLPFVLAYLLHLFYQKKTYPKTILALTSALSLLTLGIQYKEYQRYQSDMSIAQDIARHIPDASYRVQFIGKKEISAPFPSPYEPMMTSFFSWDPVDNQIRSDHMLQLVGAKFRPSTQTENQAAYKKYNQLPSYPEKDSIQVLDQEKVVLVHFK